MRSLTAVPAAILALVLVPGALAAPVGDQHLTVSSDEYTPDTVDELATVRVAADVGTSTVDGRRCSVSEMDSSTCQKAVASGAPRATVEADTELPILDLLRAAQEGDQAPASTSTQGAAYMPVLEGNAVYLAKATAAVAGAGFVAYVLSRLARYGLLGFVPMYTYIRDGDLLNDANRSRIFELIKAEPGISTKDIADRLGLAWGTVTHHLGKLEKRQFVVSKKYGKYRRYFANGAAADQVKKDTLAVLKVPATAEVATMVRDHPGFSQKQVSVALGVSSSTILWHVKRLEKVGLVSKVRDGKLVRYYPAATLNQDWQPMRDVVTPVA